MSMYSADKEPIFQIEVAPSVGRFCPEPVIDFPAEMVFPGSTWSMSAYAGVLETNSPAMTKPPKILLLGRGENLGLNMSVSTELGS